MIRNIGDITIITNKNDVTLNNYKNCKFTIIYNNNIFKTDSINIEYLTALVFTYSKDIESIYSELCRIYDSTKENMDYLARIIANYKQLN